MARPRDDRHGRHRRTVPDVRQRPPDGWRTSSRARFERIADDAFTAVPEELLSQLHNVYVAVEDVPPEDEGVLLGLYEGVPRTERFADDPIFPDRITIFRRPHELRARSRAELVDLVTETMVHEIAHHFGIDDDRLDELGWG